MREQLIFVIGRNVSIPRLMGLFGKGRPENEDDLLSLAWQDVKEALGDSMKEYPLDLALKEAGYQLPASQ